MYESVDVVGLNPSPNPFLMMDYYNQSRGCLIPEKGLVPGAPHPYSASIRNQHWNGSNHCRCPTTHQPPNPTNTNTNPSLLLTSSLICRVAKLSHRVHVCVCVCVEPPG